MKKLQARLLLIIVLLLAPQAFAAEAELPLDLIEMLGELDDEDNASLADAISEIESNSNTEKPQIKELKNEK
ncbi:MAG: hypothetical protein CTY10_03165 [Methylotenera sp.]|nr:MAG: hypothetical protein CTY10_03165 [Methylotenera sp.]